MNCTDCQKTYQAYLSDLPSEWRSQIALLMCKVIDDIDELACPDVKACETLTSLSPFTLTDEGQLSITYKDERGVSVTRSVTLNITSDEDFIQNQFDGAQTPGDYWIDGIGRAAAFEVTGSTEASNGIYLPAANTIGISANGIGVTTIASDGLLTHNGNIFLSAAISSQPAISFFLNSLAGSDYFIQRRGTTLDFHAAGIAAISVNTNVAYTANSNSLQGHEWYSMETPTNNNLMQLFPDGSLLLMTTTVQQTPDPSAIFEIDSEERGFLPPRMSSVQKNAIPSPSEGLMVYDTDLKKLCVYTTAWETVTSV